MTEPVYVLGIEEGVPRVVAEYPSDREAASDFPGLVVERASDLLSEVSRESILEAVAAYLQEKIELLEVEAVVVREEIEAVSDEVAFLRQLESS